jgi:hypothetical protein
MGAAALIGLAAVVIVLLVGLAYVMGRGIWHVAEPRDEDPGGQESPAGYLPGSTGTPFVEYLRLAKRLRKKSATTHRRVNR